MLDVQQGQMFNLNLVGSRILELCGMWFSESRSWTSSAVSSTPTREVVKNDVREFLETLKAYKLVEDASVRMKQSELEASLELSGKVIRSRDVPRHRPWEEWYRGPSHASEAGLSFPEVTIPRWQRVTENITTAMKKEWGERSFACSSSVEPPPDAAQSVQYMVAKHWRGFGKSEVPLRGFPSMTCTRIHLIDLDHSAIHTGASQNAHLWRCDPAAAHSPDSVGSRSWCEWVGRAIALEGTSSHRKLPPAECKLPLSA